LCREEAASIRLATARRSRSLEAKEKYQDEAGNQEAIVDFGKMRYLVKL
jgi:hypothetical protein